MFSLRRLVAILLVAIWLPAVLHCRVENLLGVECCAKAESAQTEKKGCEGEVCDALEAGFIKSSSDQLTVTAPQFCACLICCVEVAAPEISAPLITGIIEQATAPPEILQSRHFLVRAALPARAPDRLS